jgi:hypothetical protein
MRKGVPPCPTLSSQPSFPRGQTPPILSADYEYGVELRAVMSPRFRRPYWMIGSQLGKTVYHRTNVLPQITKSVAEHYQLSTDPYLIIMPYVTSPKVLTGMSLIIFDGNFVLSYYGPRIQSGLTC